MTAKRNRRWAESLVQPMTMAPCEPSAERGWAQCRNGDADGAVALLSAYIDATAALVPAWLSVGSEVVRAGRGASGTRSEHATTRHILCSEITGPPKGSPPEPSLSKEAG